MGVKLSKKELIILVLVLIICFVSTYKIHFNNPFPYHHDEWQHLGISTQIVDKGYNINTNPYTGEKQFHTDLESGFHIFLSNVIILTQNDLIFSYKYLASIFAVLTGFLFFVLMYDWTKNYWASILSILIFTFLKTNVNILGKDFFIPLSFALPFILAFIYYFTKALKKKNSSYFYLSFVILSVIFFIHPPSFMILIFPTLIELIFHHKFIKKIFKKRIFLVIPFIVVLIYLLIWKGTIIHSLQYLLGLIYFEQGWGKLEIKFFIPLLYGIIYTVLALTSIKWTSKNKFRFFLFSAFISLFITTLFNSYNFTVLVPYGRALYYSMFFMVPLTCFSYIKIVEFIKKKGYSFKYLQVSVVIVLVLLSFIPKYIQHENLKNYDTMILTKDEYNALKFIETNYGQDNKIVTPYFMTSAVYPVSRNNVFSLIPAQLESVYKEENLNFFFYDCITQKKLIIESKSNFILSRNELNCDFLQKIHFNKVFIYKIVN
jgi:hypothetical protein